MRHGFHLQFRCRRGNLSPLVCGQDVAADTAGFMRQARTDYLNRKITPQQLEQRIEQAMGLIRQQPANSVVLTSDVVLSKNVKIIAP